jgi:hypothetical protein
MIVTPAYLRTSRVGCSKSRCGTPRTFNLQSSMGASIAECTVGRTIDLPPRPYAHAVPASRTPKTTEAASRRPHWQRLRGSAWPEPPSTLMVAPICFRSISTVFRRRSFATTRKDAFRFSHAVAEKLQQRATTSPDRPRRIPSAPPCRMVWGACAWADSRAAKGQQRVISQGLPTQTAALQSAAGHAGKEP